MNESLSKKLISMNLKRIKEKLTDPKSILIRDSLDNRPNRVFLYNAKSKEIEEHNLIYLKEGFSNLVNKDTILNVPFVFSPDRQQGIFSFNDKLHFNSYQSPRWRLIEKDIYELPEVYVDFLTHLTSDNEGVFDKESYDYILKWMAQSLFPERFNLYLVLVAAKGVGKGILSDLLTLLHGEGNFAITGQRVLSNQFNEQLKDKTLVILDEIKIDKDDQMNRLKVLINNVIEIEGKGTKVGMSKNYSSVLITSNHLDIFKITTDERRFSIPFITNLKVENRKDLMEKYSINSLIALLKDPDNIASLGHYLLFLGSSQQIEMNTPFLSSRTSQIIEHSLKDWESAILDFFNSCISMGDKDTRLYSEDIARIIENAGIVLKNPPGRNALTDLCGRIKYLDYKYDNSRNKRYLCLIRNKK